MVSQDKEREITTHKNVEDIKVHKEEALEVVHVEVEIKVEELTTTAIKYLENSTRNLISYYSKSSRMISTLRKIRSLGRNPVQER